MNNVIDKYLIGGRFIFDPNESSLTDTAEDNDFTRLGSNENRALILLLKEPGAVISRGQLHDYVWREQGFEVDDSSITQAISTLRKALKDSTKSPGFVKTVPKRGYQMIASIELYQPEPEVIEESVVEASSDELVEAVSTAENAEVYFDNEIVPPLVQQAEPKVAEPSPSPSKVAAPVTSSPNKMLVGLGVVLSLLLPLLTWLTLTPEKAELVELQTVEGAEGVTVYATPNHSFTLAQWKPVIDACVNQHLAKDQFAEKLDTVIASSNNDMLWINFIYQSDAVANNFTIRLLTDTQDSSALCQQ